MKSNEVIQAKEHAKELVKKLGINQTVAFVKNAHFDPMFYEGLNKSEIISKMKFWQLVQQEVNILYQNEK